MPLFLLLLLILWQVSPEAVVVLALASLIRLGVKTSS